MSWTVEIESLVSASRMFDAAILDWHNLGPKIAPEVLVSGTQEGSTRQLNFTSAMPFSYLKERMDFVDHETFECESTITEGGHWGTRLKSVSINYKIAEAPSGVGCAIKVVTATNPLPGIELDDEAVGVIDKAKEVMVKHFKTVEAYLLANPEKYYAIPVAAELYPVSGNDDEADVDDHDVMANDGDDGNGGGSHPRDFHGIQVNGVYGGTVNIGAVEAPKIVGKVVRWKVVKQPGWQVSVRVVQG